MKSRRSPHQRAAASLWWLAGVAAGLVVLSVIGIALGLQSLLASTNAAVRAVECCGTIFSKCLVSPSMLRATLPWIGLGVLLAGLLRAIRNGWRTVRANRRFLGGLRGQARQALPVLAEVGRSLGLQSHVRLVDTAPSREAFTAGILVPRIYVTRGLCEALSREELVAVLLHEDHHRRSRDPVRALVILFLQDLLFFLPIGYVLRRIFFEAREEAADDAVARGGGDSLELASALCRLAKLEKAKPGLSPLAWISGSGRVQRRVERLLSPNQEAHKRPGAARLLVSVVVGTLLVVSLYLPILMTSSPFEFQGCSPDYCRDMECMQR